MEKMKSWQRIAIACCVMSMLVACGQKGDLYLPEGKSIISWMS
ncbi:MAG: lipoprotein [Piscirickettsiaceae bacterium]|nr:lipoprotein [Piscirickettsiaceae bacterium]